MKRERLEGLTPGVTMGGWLEEFGEGDRAVFLD